jgi:alpha-glucosidase
MRLPPFAFLVGLAVAAPSPLIPRADTADTSKCPGYTASNVVTTDWSLKADLKLNGAKCNAYGDDLEELKLEVEYQTSSYALSLGLLFN